MTFAWVGDTCDPSEIAKIIYFDGPTREKALKMLATMSATIRSQYPTPETFYGLCLAELPFKKPVMYGNT